MRSERRHGDRFSLQGKVTWPISVRVFLRAAGWYVNGYFAKLLEPRKISGLLRKRGYGVDACW
jgi:hypothetical protein